MPRNRVSISTIILAWVLVFFGFAFLIVRALNQDASTNESRPDNEVSLRQEAQMINPAENEPILDTPQRLPYQIPGPREISPLPVHPMSLSFGNSDLKPAQETNVLKDIFVSFKESLGTFPTAESNAQVVAQLRGANSAKRAWFPEKHRRLNADGELLDAFGTPFFFHFESSQSMTVRSAGPDKELYTQDDYISSSPSQAQSAYQGSPIIVPSN